MAGLAMGPMGWDSYWSAPMYNKLVPNFRKRVGRNPMRHKYKRGGRFKKKSRRACLLGMNPEKKFLDLQVSTTPAVAGTVVNLAVIVQGDGESERIGRKVTVTDILAHGRITLSSIASNTDASNRVRIMVVQDRSTNGATFSAAALMNTAGTADIDSFRDLSHIGRFQVLYNRLWTINPNWTGISANATSANAFRDVRFNLKCCIPIEYDASASTGAITTQQVNSIHILTFEESAAPATAVDLTTRVRYLG